MQIDSVSEVLDGQDLMVWKLWLLHQIQRMLLHQVVHLVGRLMRSQPASLRRPSASTRRLDINLFLTILYLVFFLVGSDLGLMRRVLFILITLIEVLTSFVVFGINDGSLIDLGVVDVADGFIALVLVNELFSV